jgi:hypothetical protein
MVRLEKTDLVNMNSFTSERPDPEHCSAFLNQLDFCGDSHDTYTNIEIFEGKLHR